MPAGIPHPPELRVKAVAAVIAGESIHKVARRYGLPYSTVAGWWRDECPVDTGVSRTRERMVEEIYDTVSDLLAAIRAALQSSSADPAWVAQQDASGLADLLATQLDSAVRLLAGVQPRREQLADDDDRRALDAAYVDAAARPADVSDDV